jgi:uridine kinase
MNEPSPLASLVSAARAAAPRAAGTTVVAIDGRSGAGKSTLAAELALELEAPIVALEDLYGGWDGLAAGIVRLVAAVLAPIAAGRSARVPRYDWQARSWSEPWLLPAPELLIVEGVGAGARATAPYTSLLVWIERAPAVRRERTWGRDGAVYDDAQWRRWAALEQAYVERERPRERADIVLGGA